MRMEGHVGPARYSDNIDALLRLGNDGEAIVGELGSKYAEQSLRGNSFVFPTTTAASVTALGNNIPTIFNPLGSGVSFVLTKVTMQVGAVGTPAVSGFQYGYLANAGAQIGTASPILTATFVAGINCLIGGRVPKVLFAPAAITFTTAPALLAPVGFNLGSTATETPYNLVDDVDGRIALPPGTALQIGASTTTSKTFNIAFWGYERALPLTGQ
jgi:hypothetical protein